MQTLPQPHLSSPQLPRAPGCCHHAMLQLTVPCHCHLHKNKHICSSLKRGTKRSGFLRQHGEFEHSSSSSIKGSQSARKVVPKMFPVRVSMIHLTHHLLSWISAGPRGWTAEQQPQLRDQGLLLCTSNGTGPRGPTFMDIAVFPQDTFWADMFYSPCWTLVL